MNDMQRLKEGHNRAVAELVREHRVPSDTNQIKISLLVF